MAKEFLQKHFINEAKAAINRWSGSGGTAPDPVIQPLTVTENGTYTAPDGVDGYSPVNVEIASTGGTDERFKQLVEGTLTEVNDNTVTSVCEYAFYYHPQLTSIVLPLVTSVGKYAFQSCFQLTSIYLPLVTSVGIGAFQTCYKLTSIDLPLVTSVGSVMFQSCTNLSCVILRAETVCALSSSNAFGGTPFASGKAGGTLLVPRALVDSYKTATNWSVIWGYGHNRFLALEDYTVDGTITGEIDWDKLAT